MGTDRHPKCTMRHNPVPQRVSYTKKGKVYEYLKVTCWRCDYLRKMEREFNKILAWTNS